MAQVELRLNGEIFRLPELALRQTCTAFQANPLPPQYRVASNVPSEVFRTFLSAVKGEPIEVTLTNFTDLRSLCDEFGFQLSTPSYHLCKIEIAVESLRADIGRLGGEVAALRGTPAVVAQFPAEVAQLRADVFAVRSWKLSVSAIVSDFPALFAEFRGKYFNPLWRGSRDGFSASQFHDRCDGHANTVTVVLDTNDNIFGGFTPVKWESKVWNGKPWAADNCFEADESQQSFLFTLKNPNGVTPRRFGLKEEMKQFAVYRCDRFGPCFGGSCWGCDFGVSDPSNDKDKSSTSNFGHIYINDTGRDGKTLLTGSAEFKVKEIEVFEIIN
jgi:hypothetical protein